MFDRGIGREILMVAHDTKLSSINFLAKNQENMSFFLHMDYFVANHFFWKSFD
jgi:hypothetical protein